MNSTLRLTNGGFKVTTVQHEKKGAILALLAVAVGSHSLGVNNYNISVLCI